MAYHRDPEKFLGYLLFDVTRLLRRNFNKRVKSLGLTQSQWRAIVQLSRREGINQAELAELMEIAPISLARLLDRMPEWIDRRPDPQDRRAMRLYLTDKAQEVLPSMFELADQTWDIALEGIPEKKRDALRDTLAEIKANLMNVECHGGCK